MVFGRMSLASPSVLTLMGWLLPELETELPVLPIEGTGDVGALGKQRWGVSGSRFQDSGATASCGDRGGDVGWGWGNLGLDTTVLQRYHPVSHGTYGQPRPSL